MNLLKDIPVCSHQSVIVLFSSSRRTAQFTQSRLSVHSPTSTTIIVRNLDLQHRITAREHEQRTIIHIKQFFRFGLTIGRRRRDEVDTRLIAWRRFEHAISTTPELVMGPAATDAHGYTPACFTWGIAIETGPETPEECIPRDLGAEVVNRCGG